MCTIASDETDSMGDLATYTPLPEQMTGACIQEQTESENASSENKHAFPFNTCMTVSGP